ncbi:hypothetical protein MICA_1201 [Micavibrio aeruginosavorus ARL-13]|uniref:Uncharacterized protein n=1 Tax=Micavibrio aeruginosavorus (strain ARL-13) TaxID=856793 RepID=G2KRG2_MICAA|nr:hypothetical protein MICA_1201 [Micavibrio aeruginosavorus ARL-13]
MRPITRGRPGLRVCHKSCHRCVNRNAAKIKVYDQFVNESAPFGCVYPQLKGGAGWKVFLRCHSRESGNPYALAASHHGFPLSRE